MATTNRSSAQVTAEPTPDVLLKSEALLAMTKWRRGVLSPTRVAEKVLT